MRGMSGPGSLNRVRGGVKAREFGNGFEGVFEKLCRLQGIAITEIPDGCKQIGPNPRTDIIRVKSPFDWVLTFRGKTVLVDTKTIESHLFSNSQIKKHQVEPMASHEMSGGKAGYVVWLREPGQVFFLSATALVIQMQTRGSFSETHPESILLGKSYDFDIRKIFESV
jgi:penicillin-binding protein-related factor A (putative recombinase)